MDISQMLASKGYIAIPLRQNVTGQLLVDAKVNDVVGLYILDTGAGQTVVDANKASAFNLEFNLDETVFTGGGVGAHSIENVPSYGNRLDLGNFKMDNLVIAVMSLETAWESLAQVGAHDDLSGIIGVDVLKAGNAIIEFSTLTLYLNTK